MNLVGQVARNDGEFEINWRRPNPLRIPTDRQRKSPARQALIACSSLVNHHQEGCESAGGQSTTREKRQRRTGMALKVELKPHERIIIGACVVTNTDQRARLLIDGDRIPILREKD